MLVTVNRSLFTVFAGRRLTFQVNSDLAVMLAVSNMVHMDRVDIQIEGLACLDSIAEKG